MRYVNCEFFSIQRHVDLFAIHISHYSAHDIFNLKLWFENNLHRLRMDSLLGSVVRRINSERRFSLSNMQRKKGSKKIEMIIKTVHEFKLTVVHFG